MVAAVADYTPAGAGRARRKLLRDRDELVLTLRRTPDILGALGRWRAGRARPVLVGFAAEVGDPVARAREKLRRKQVDLVVANDVSRPGAGFERRDEHRHPDLGHGGGGNPARVQARARARPPRPDRASPRRGGRRLREECDVTDREQLEAHLEFFRELGVEGISGDPVWRRRAVEAPAAETSPTGAAARSRHAGGRP